MTHQTLPARDVEACRYPPQTPAALRRRWAGADHLQRRAIIVEAALDLLDRKGLSAVTMRAVATRLGLGTMTLYTYLANQQQLHRDMIRRGFEIFSQHCRGGCTIDGPGRWRGGARTYVLFAIANPNLYKLMFDVPIDPEAEEDQAIVRGGFQNLLDNVTLRLAARGLEGPELTRQARAAAGQFWISLHGLASLAIAGRLPVLGGDLDAILDDLLHRVAPD